VRLWFHRGLKHPTTSYTGVARDGRKMSSFSIRQLEVMLLLLFIEGHYYNCDVEEMYQNSHHKRVE